MQKNKTKYSVKSLVISALIAGIYVALCFVFAPISYGSIQIRISEILSILPIFTPNAILGLTVGCFISNMLSFSPWDMLLGTLATFLSAILTFKFKNIRFKSLPILSILPPIIINAIIIGFEITYIFMPEVASAPVLIFNMLTVAIGQFISCFVGGLILIKIIEKSPKLKDIISFK